ncbi:type VI secretion system protein ImpK [Pseudomonas fluorescens]|uniref:Type VI secretion system protein ImpK n=2 Tax=Pseudomonas TaxID=286 RepID=A0A345UYS6_PSEFL|nr:MULTISPECIES: DotU/TssL family secretion system protein [Pseudomonas]AXJ05628.1 type VI secretion system protein ImpK [Pseudomonas fluorescens]UFP97911.1 DotU/TssL family secretion system protein [Pseudomonas fitomaticsae]WJK07719.1 DotU/TssL family secretion system protein [Pseudomonas fluorescens]
MSQGSAASLGLQDAPLSSAFRETWQQWSQDWSQLPKDSEDEAALVETVVELSTQASQRLWRTAFARVGDSATEQVKALVYAFVALVDETLLFSPWPGQSAWQEKPLESRLYSSRQAGEQVPAAIQTLLDEQQPTTRDLANVYLQCLILGFHGRLRGELGQVQREKWRRALFMFAWQDEADYAAVSQRLVQPSLATPLQLPVRTALPDGFRLALGILAMILLLTGLGQFLWRDIRQELEPVLQAPDTLTAPEQDS